MTPRLRYADSLDVAVENMINHSRATLMLRGWTRQGSKATSHLIGSMHLEDLPARVNLYVEVVSPLGEMEGNDKETSFPLDEPVEFKIGGESWSVNLAPEMRERLGGSNVIASPMKGPAGGDDAFKGLAISGYATPPLLRFGGLALAAWHLHACPWKELSGITDPLPGADDGADNITELTQATKVTAKFGPQLSFTGDTETAMWSFERPSLLSPEPPPDDKKG